MRLAGQAKLGYFPASPNAIAAMVNHLTLRPPNPERASETVQVIDPCAGEGAAVKQIADALGIDEASVYTVELDAGRAQAVNALMPRGQHLGPASALGVQVTAQSFGLAYVNPPFDFEGLGSGRREEQAFAERATRWLVPHGVLLLVCPFRALVGNREFVQFLDAHYEDLAVFKFPDGDRPYNEIVVFGRKRRQAIPGDAVYEHGTLHRMKAQYTGYITLDALPALGQCQPDRELRLRTFQVPRAWRPTTFKKTAFTDDELCAVLSSSPLNRHLRQVAAPPPMRPPLPLDKGHLGLILASGMLDGPVVGPHGVHIVRGSSHKVEYHNKEQSTSEENPDSGAVTSRDVFSQRMVTVIRCVDETGVIYTHSNAPSEDHAEAETDCEEDRAIA